MAGKRPMLTDSGHRIADCVCAAIDDPEALQAQLAGIVGVIESGLFIGLASQIVVGRAGGVELVAG
jgi:ribose 5-phosphate isomerase A